MSNNIFEEGGPHNIRRTGQHEYEMHIKIPTDDDGLVGRDCPNDDCSPGYFKIKPGTGFTGGQHKAYCPYCRTDATASDFATQAQKDYAIAHVTNVAIEGIDRIIEHSLDLDSTGKKRFGTGSITIEMS